MWAVARCIISPVVDTADGQEVMACTVHTSYEPCPDNGKPASTAPVHVETRTRAAPRRSRTPGSGSAGCGRSSSTTAPGPTTATTNWGKTAGRHVGADLSQFPRADRLQLPKGTWLVLDSGPRSASQQPPYYPQPCYPPRQGADGLGVASFVLSLFWGLGFLSLLAVIFGHDRPGGSGRQAGRRRRDQ